MLAFILAIAIAIVAVILGFVLWDVLDDLSDQSHTRRGRLLEFTPFGAAFIALCFALLYTGRVVKGEFIFTFAPTGEPMDELLAYRYQVDRRATGGDLVADLAARFATGDPRAYAPLPQARGPLGGRILTAPNSRVAIATVGFEHRASPVSADPIVLHGPAFDALIGTSKRVLRTGKFSAGRGRELDALFARA